MDESDEVAPDHGRGVQYPERANAPARGGGVHVSGGVSGQIAVGHHIRQSQHTSSEGPVTETDLAELRHLVEALAARVAAEAPPESRDSALDRVDELGKALDPARPRVHTLAAVRDWFVDHLPKLAGAVTSVIVNPLVGRLVEAAGDVASRQFTEFFGGDSGQP
jgi:hypothetical protein